MAATTFSLEPKEFMNLHMDRATDMDMVLVQTNNDSPVAPKISHDTDGIWVAAPKLVTINTDNAATFVWEDIKIPLSYSYQLLDKEFRFFNKQTLHVKNLQTGEVLSVWADIMTYNGKPPAPEPPETYDPNRGSGGSCTYNITFFTELPRYSSEYEVWVTVGSVESDRARFQLELFENGKRIQRE